jgi:hypothetical protein
MVEELPLKGKPREMGFGSFTKVSLADARRKASDARLLLSDGHDGLQSVQTFRLRSLKCRSRT